MVNIEIWKSAKNISLSKYSVSSNGRVKNNRTGFVLVQQSNPKGYKSVSLYNDDNKYKPYAVHRLVALVFIPKVEGKPTVDHKDQNPANNKLSNLAWASMKDQAKNRTYPKTVIKQQFKVCQLNADDNSLIKVWDSSYCVAEQFKVSARTVRNACKNNNKKWGYKWVFYHTYFGTSIEGEIWKKIEIKTKTDYYVSSMGRLKNHKGLILEGTDTANDYVMFTLTIDTNIYKQELAHVLIAETFILNRPDGMIVNHKNGIKNDNKLDNLEFITQRGNVQHAHDTGLIKKRYDSKSVIQLSLEGSEIGRYVSPAEAARALLSEQIHNTSKALLYKKIYSTANCISSCCKGITGLSYGYKWKYAD